MISSRQIQLLEELPPVAAPSGDVPLRTPPTGTVWCGSCRLPMPLSEAYSYFTGLCQVVDQTCPDCLRGREKHCPVVCLVCHSVVARIPPHRDPSGFVFEPRQFYHTNSCPNCQPEKNSSTLLEKICFEQRKRG